MKSRWSLLLFVGLLWAGCALPPLPNGPAPQPNPAPVVKVDSVWVITIDDWTQRAKNSSVRDVFNDTAYWVKLRQRGHHFSEVDAADAGPYQIQITEGEGLPVLILLNAATRKELTAVKLPATTAGIDSIIAKYSSK